MGFVFAACRPGSEALLKREVARLKPDLRLAFSRPGFVTFKTADLFGDDADWMDPSSLPTVFARVRGLSFGRAGTSSLPGPDRATAIVDAARRLGAGARVRLHAFARDADDPREDASFDPLAAAALAEIRTAVRGEDPFHDDPVARPGDLVLDVAAFAPDEWWVGAHRHADGLSPYPGGRPLLSLPADAPSRAWLKLEEAIAFTGAPIRAGETAVEIGSAPGGASWALLNRGVSVWGIDPAAMDPRVTGFPGPARFTHVRRPVSLVRARDLPREVHWLLLDVNEGPESTVPEVERLVPALAPALRGVLLTVKANRVEVADRIPDLVQRFRRLGLSGIRAAQLAFHHREFLLAGFTSAPLARPAAAPSPTPRTPSRSPRLL